MLEKMDEFFDNRLEGYDEHQLNCIDSAREFLKFTAECLPAFPGCTVLDLGCGTGLELEEYFSINPSAKVTGIDMAPEMLKRLKEKFPDKNIHLILGSYFDAVLGNEVYDAAVSVESLHHFTAEEKIPLYEKVRRSIKPDGCFILTDYFSLSDEEERHHRKEFLRIKEEEGISDDTLYHYDTPLTVDHEIECLKRAGFLKAEILKNWGHTYTLRGMR